MALFKRILFSLRMMRRYRHALANIVQNSPSNRQLCQIPPITFKEQGVAVIVLDFDGVLAAHGEPYPAPELRPWLRDCIALFGPEQVFVLSNKPLSIRIEDFNRHYPGVRYIAEVKKKPYPDGLQKIMAITGQPAQALMLVDDRLLTGGLAACIANVPMTYITRPYVRLSKRPVQELFFMILRFLERLPFSV
jgi:predicted HAD superfamily phosphohydrolase YqeG